MIRYADETDLDTLRAHDKHIGASELKKSIQAKRVLVMFDGGFIGWLRFNLFWDTVPFMNMLYLLAPYRGKGYGTQLVEFWEREMARKHHKLVMTSTRADEHAQFFYRKNGYADCGSLLLPNEPLELIFQKRLA